MIMGWGDYGLENGNYHAEEETPAQDTAALCSKQLAAAPSKAKTCRYLPLAPFWNLKNLIALVLLYNNKNAALIPGKKISNYNIIIYMEWQTTIEVRLLGFYFLTFVW